ncbi:MAG: hypothetical protein KC443_05335, partial [Anaerolineales bacterium]|nr:hypothetical protein [Anaerolineales bacterium]
VWQTRLPAAVNPGLTSSQPALGPLAEVTPPTRLDQNSVLIIQDSYPWGYDVIQQILNAHGIAYDQVDSSMMATLDLSAYDLIIVPGVQPTNFYLNWNTYIDRFEDYVMSGGALWLSGTTGDTPLVPGGLVNHYGPDDYNDVQLPDHPWVVGVPNLISGSSASHNYFTNLPGNALVVAESSVYGEATLVDYEMGVGRILLTGQTLEIAWAYGWDAAPILENSLLDMYMWQHEDVPWLVIEPVSGTVPGYTATTVQVTFDASWQQPGVYTAEIIVDSNAPVNGRQSVPVTMTVSPATGMGRVTGAVSDLWTGDPVTATVQLAGVYTGTAAPDYTIWANPGIYDLVVWATGYITQTYTITIPTEGVVVQDVALELAQPRLQGLPEALTIPTIPGIVFSHTFVITNGGPLPLAYEWYEIPPALHQRHSPYDLNGKIIMYDRAHGESDLYDYSTLAADINAAGGIITENFAYPITANSLANMDVLWVDCCGYMDWTFAELQTISDWMEAGGAVLVHSSQSGTAYQVAGIYNVLYDCCSYSSGTTTNIAPHPTTIGVDAIHLEYSYAFLTVTEAAVVTVYDTNDMPQTVAQEQNGGKMVVIDSSVFSNYSIGQADNAVFALNVFTWLAEPAYGEVPWITASPPSGMIAGHQAQEMTLVIDSNDLALGTYEAVLALEHDDPAQLSPVTFPVTLEVGEQFAAVSLIPAADSGNGQPGELVTYTLEVRNMGNGPDTFAIAVSGTWSATPSIVSTGELLPNQSEAFTVVVQIPITAENTPSETTVTVSSQFDPNITQTATLTTTAFVVGPPYALYLPVVLKP